MYLIIFRSSENRDYDRYILTPLGMTSSQGALLADEIIVEVKENFLEATWDEMEVALEDKGFRALNAWCHAEQEV
jgi:hypothetical protein